MAAVLPIPVEARKILVSIFGPICMVALIMTALFHIWSLRSKKVKINPVSIKLSYALIINAIFTEITLVMLLFSNLMYSQSYCDALLITGPPSWTTYKLLMYLILTRRAEECFGKSAFAYSTVKIRIWMIILIIWSIINCVCNISLSTFFLSSDPNEVPRCDVILYPPFVISMILLDLVGGFGSAYLMIKPLLTMNKMRKEAGQETSDKLHDIAQKQAILSGISIGTSWFALIMISLTANMHLVWVSIDLVMSTMTVILIYDWNKWLFQKLCGCCNKQQETEINKETGIDKQDDDDGNDDEREEINVSVPNLNTTVDGKTTVLSMSELTE